MKKIMNYNEIIEHINNGYEPLQDLRLLLKYNRLNNKEKYRVFITGNYIDVYGGNLTVEHIPTHIAFGRVILGYDICHQEDYDYIYKE